MARIGNIQIGGRNVLDKTGNPIISGVAFELSNNATIDHVYSPGNDNWEVELKSGKKIIVARCSDELSRSDVLSQGWERAQRCLDLLSFEKRVTELVRRPGDRHILLFARDGYLVLQHVDFLTLTVSTSCSVVVTDREGNIVPPNPVPESVWSPSLRYYRLSQASQDLYEAYRNLFLAFEALLYTICPKEPSEGERRWLLRAISTTADQVNLCQFVPPDRRDDPSAYIVGTQYDHIRCRLFHAKPGAEAAMLDIPDPEEVASAYEQLIRIWRQLAHKYLSVHREGDGGMTYIGFKRMMDRAMSEGLRMFFTDDPSPAKKEDTEVSPLGREVFPLSDVRYLSETAPGRVSFVGTQFLTGGNEYPPVYRICLMVGESLMAVATIDEGLYLESIDIFESLQITRLINKDLPRTLFGTSDT